jgi:uncharacterized protein with HEPN domain
MSEGSAATHLTDIVETIERVRAVMGDTPLDAFEEDWRKQWLIERGVEIISEASRRLPETMKARRQEIPWSKVAGIGNVLRHEYGSVSAPVMWQLVKEHLPPLDQACRQEMAHLPSVLPWKYRLTISRCVTAGSCEDGTTDQAAAG